MYFNPITILSLMWVRENTLKFPVKAGLNHKVRLNMDLAYRI
jgi:hypothetical protein